MYSWILPEKSLLYCYWSPIERCNLQKHPLIEVAAAGASRLLSRPLGALVLIAGFGNV